jgi:hypothetical protein
VYGDWNKVSGKEGIVFHGNNNSAESEFYVYSNGQNNKRNGITIVSQTTGTRNRQPQEAVADVHDPPRARLSTQMPVITRSPQRQGVVWVVCAQGEETHVLKAGGEGTTRTVWAFDGGGTVRILDERGTVMVRGMATFKLDGRMYTGINPEEDRAFVYAGRIEPVQLREPEPVYTNVPSDHDLICVVCLERARQYTLQDCGHACVCGHCANVLVQEANPKCPKCRAPIQNLQKWDFDPHPFLKQANRVEHEPEDEQMIPQTHIDDDDDDDNDIGDSESGDLLKPVFHVRNTDNNNGVNGDDSQ